MKGKRTLVPGCHAGHAHPILKISFWFVVKNREPDSKKQRRLSSVVRPQSMTSTELVLALRINASRGNPIPRLSLQELLVIQDTVQVHTKRP